MVGLDLPVGVRAPKIAIIDYGIGNLRSAEKAVQHIGADGFLTSDPRAISEADGVVLPGVGAMARCMHALAEAGLRSATDEAIASGRPFLAVCVGMQMLHAGSDEHGGVAGLGVFAATVRRIEPDPTTGLKVPQMQWNVLDRVPGRSSLLLDGLVQPTWAYFVHSFAPEFHDGVVATCAYGQQVSAVVESGNIGGTQFHPEKSGAHGLALLTGFARRCVRVEDMSA
jgi:imidazole glycerol-phosphate synthase subunit HisH